MTGSRLLKVRVLEALQSRVKQFRTREELWPLRVPREPLPLADVIESALGDDRHGFDPATLRSRSLLHLTWERTTSEPHADVGREALEEHAEWEAWAIALPSGLKVYCDSGSDGPHVLASGGRNEGDESDRLFLRLLAESGGDHFGIEMSGGAPTRVRSAISSRAFLVDFFVDLFEVTGTEDSVRARLDDVSRSRPDHGSDFRLDVESWLERAVRA